MKNVAFFVLVVSLSLSVVIPAKAQCAPPNYCSRTDTSPAPGPNTPPSGLIGLTGAGNIVTDPDFNNRILRVTDANTSGSNHVLHTASSAEQNIFSSDNSIFQIIVDGGLAFFYAWNPSTMTATKKNSAGLSSASGVSFAADGLNFGYLPADNTSFFSFGSGAPKVYKYTINKAGTNWQNNNLQSTDITPSLLLDTSLSTCLGSGTNGAGLGASTTIRYLVGADTSVSGDDSRVSLATRFVQDSGFVHVIWDSTLGCRWYDHRSGRVGGWGIAPQDTTLHPLVAPPAPTVTATTGGSLTQGHTYGVVISYTVAGIGETKVSSNSNIADNAPNNAIKVTPPSQPSGLAQATGFNVYVCDITNNPNCTRRLQTNGTNPSGLLAQPVISSAICNSGCGSTVMTYWVVAKNAGGRSVLSAPFSISNGPNTGSNGAVNSFNISVNYSAVSNAISYEVLRDSPLQLAGTSTTTSFTDSQAELINTYVDEVNTINTTPVITTVLSGSATPPTSNTAGFAHHNSRLDKSGKWLRITARAGMKPIVAFWNVETNTVITCGSGGQVVNCASGHQALGYDYAVDIPSNSSEFDIHAQTPDTDPVLFANSDIKLTNDGFLGGAQGYQKHESYNNAQSGLFWPLVFDSYLGFSLPVHAWEDEVIGVATDGSQTTYRFCHNWSSGSTAFNSTSGVFFSEPRGNVSQDGKWFAFTSDMQVNGSGLQGSSSVGVGSTSGTATCTASTTGNCRHDVFICELK